MARLKHFAPPPTPAEEATAAATKTSLVQFVPASDEIVRPTRRPLPKRRWLR